jgi:hypothetical protein
MLAVLTPMRVETRFIASTSSGGSTASIIFYTGLLAKSASTTLSNHLKGEDQAPSKKNSYPSPTVAIS